MAKTKEEYRLSPEIEKLAERLAKDPSSKLFLPLAEEYAKGGMYEEALTVLKDGLKHHPGYVSARVALGKVYLNKGLLKEALGEFNKVLAVNPDNLLVHKKLADLHKKLGNKEEAIKSCNSVLLLNPKDEEIKGLLKQLEANAAASPERVIDRPKVEAKEPVKEPLQKEPAPAHENLAPSPSEQPKQDEITEVFEQKPESMEAVDIVGKDINEESHPVKEETAVGEGDLNQIEDAFKIPDAPEDIINLQEDEAKAKQEGSLWEIPVEKEEDIPVSLEESNNFAVDVGPEKANDDLIDIGDEKDISLEGLVRPDEVKQDAMAIGPEENVSENGSVPVYDLGDEELISFPNDLVQSDEDIAKEPEKKEDAISLDSFPDMKIEDLSEEKAAEVQQDEDMIIIEEPEDELISLEKSEPEIEPLQTVAKEENLAPERIPEDEPVPSTSESLDAGEKIDTELATETLAELYIKQGFYDKGIEIYRKLLKENPGNSTLIQKLKDAVTLANLLATNQQKKYEEIIPGVAIDKEMATVDNIEIEEIPVAQAEVSDAAAPEIPVEEPKKAEVKSKQPEENKSKPKIPKQKAKIERLQSWLENLKKG